MRSPTTSVLVTSCQTTYTLFFVLGLFAIATCTSVSAQSDPQGTPSPTQLAARTSSSQEPAATLREVEVGDFLFELGNEWTQQDDVAPDEAHWSIDGADVQLLRDRSLDDLDNSLVIESRIETRLLGSEALLVEGVSFSAAGPRRVRMIVHVPVRETDQLAWLVSASPQLWLDQGDELAAILSSLRKKGEPASGIDLPTSQPSPGPSDSTSEPSPIDHGLTSQRTYTHARGGYRLDIPEGWSLASGWSMERLDSDFDTLWDSRREVAVVLARVRERVSNPGSSLDQWLRLRKDSLSGAQELRSTTVSWGGAQGVALSYLEPSSGLASWRFSLVQAGHRYAISVYAQQSSTEKLPFEAEKLLESLVFVGPQTIDESSLSEYTQPGLRVRLAPHWRSVDDPNRFAPNEELDALWILEQDGQLSRLKLFRIVQNASPVQQTERTLLIGMIPTHGSNAWWKLGSRHVSGSMIATACFNRIDSSGLRWCLELETPIEQWPVMESEFRRIVDDIRFPGSERIDPLPMPRFSSPYSTLDSVPGFKGDAQYMLINRPEGVEVRNVATNERAFLPLSPYGSAVDPIIASTYLNDPNLAEKLGAPIGDTVSVFDDALRIQVFRKGTILLESAHRVFWWSGHDERSLEE